jgi:hypothetical protein
MQTIAAFEKKLTTILMIAMVRVNYNQLHEWFHPIAFDNLSLRSRRSFLQQPVFYRTLVMKMRFAGHHEARQALAFSIAGVAAIMLIAYLILMTLY